MREWNHRRSDVQDVVMTSSGIPLSQLSVSKVICILKSAHHDVVSIYWSQVKVVGVYLVKLFPLYLPQ